MKTALIVAGGTGGHLYPGIALARTLSERKWSVRFAVRRGDLGKEILSREGFTTYELAGQGMPRRFSWQAFRFPIRLAQGTLEAARLLHQVKPNVVIGMGGYLSFPVLMGARLAGIHTVIHEQNVLPGVANRFLSRVVSSVAVSFEASRRYFPSKKTWVCGLPVRAEIGTVSRAEGRQRFGLDPKRITFLVFGGSLGAQRLNQIVPTVWSLVQKTLGEFQILHVSGTKEADATQALYRAQNIKASVIPYCHDMAAAYAGADLVICRSGASTVAELLAAQRPAVFIPYPYASGDHQRFNAKVMASKGLATILIEKDMSRESLMKAILSSVEGEKTISKRQREFEDLGAEDPRTAAVRLAEHIEGLL